MKKLLTEEFINRCRKIHAKTFDYSKVNYVNAKTKVEIICTKHGSFWQNPYGHLQGKGCDHCGGGATGTTESFISKSQEVHNHKYDYSKVLYKNNRVKVEIICPIHGSFWQIPNVHLNNKSGCPMCAGTKKSTTEIFIEKARQIHGDLYDYSKSIYINRSKVKIEIICPIHGSFWQLPSNHLKGHGCSMCAGVYTSNTQEFIIKAKKVHGDKYDYSNVHYVNGIMKVKIICPKHGIFFQTPSGHLKKGCSQCVYQVSKSETQWLDEYNVPKELRQIYIRVGNKGFKVDGFDPKTNTVYEFFGDYWHGNPKRFNPNDMNKTVKKTFGTLYQETMNKIKCLQEAGYNIKYIWESDYKTKC